MICNNFCNKVINKVSLKMLKQIYVVNPHKSPGIKNTGVSRPKRVLPSVPHLGKVR